MANNNYVKNSEEKQNQFEELCEELLADITTYADENWMQPFYEDGYDLKVFYETFINDGSRCAPDVPDFFDNVAIYDTCFELLQMKNQNYSYDDLDLIIDAIHPRFIEWMEADYRARFGQENRSLAD